MNIDVQILGKLICNRMSVFSNNVIGIDQTCALKGRSVLDNAHLHRNVVDYCNQKNINCAFISLDQEKAFDKIVHKFLFKGILSTSCVIFSYPKLLSISVLTFIK
jgi:hypothetical protein